MKPDYCTTCKHAEFAHTGQGWNGKHPKGCNLCQSCREYKSGG